MKRYLILLPLLFALSIGTLLAGHRWINSARDQIEITETVLAGDPAAAGVTITYSAEDQDRQLLWNTVFSPGRAGEAETDFTLSLVSRNYPHTWSDYVSIYTFGNMGYSTSSSSDWLADRDANTPDTPILAIRDVVGRTQNGEERTETVRLADYYEYYPLVLDAGRGYMWDSMSSLDIQRFSDYFRLKVPEEKRIKITVQKDEDGNLVHLRIDLPENDPWDDLDVRGVVVDSGIYLIATSVTEGVPDDRLQCPDGPGVHFIPALEDLEDAEPPGRYLWWDPAGIRLFYPTGEARTADLSLSRDESKLLLYAVESGRLALTVLDIETGTALQHLDLMAFEEESGRLTWLAQDDLLYIQQGDTFCLIQETDGQYKTVLTGRPSEELDLYYPNCTRLAWDGQRMAFVTAAEYCCAYTSGIGSQILLGVWDAAGLQFLGAYDYSISRDPYAQRNLFGYSSTYDPLQIAFSGP